jgi:hypothetical protein
MGEGSWLESHFRLLSFHFDIPQRNARNTGLVAFAQPRHHVFTKAMDDLGGTETTYFYRSSEHRIAFRTLRLFLA